MPAAIDSTTFVADVRPLLERNDLPGLVSLLRDRWDACKIAEMLRRPDSDARQVALLCLALVGTSDTIPQIPPHLADPDPTVNQLAEHALWSIWFRAGPAAANAQLCRGAKELAARRYKSAIEHFDQAIAIAPNFPEPYNQRALTRFVLEQYEASIGDCRRTVRLMPCHFGAWAGMGHCFLHLGQLDHALRAYDRALEINPHMRSISQAATEIRQRV